MREYGGAELVTNPVSALAGDNVVDASARMPWYTGPTLLEHLEAVPVWTEIAAEPFRMLVQRVIRPDQSYRGFAGQIASGTVRRRDAVLALPSGRSSLAFGLAIALVGTGVHMFGGQYAAEILVKISIGGIVGGVVGSGFAPKIPNRALKLALSLWLCVLGLQFCWQAVHH